MSDAEVYIGGALAASSAASFDRGDPTVLTDVAVTWGRGTTLDQPEPTSASFRIAQRHGRAEFLSRLQVGSPVEILATGNIEHDPDEIPLITDPGFEQQPPRGTVNGGEVAISRVHVHTGRQAVRLTPAGRTGIAWTLPPAPPTSDPTGWDRLPKTSAGEVWRVSAWVGAVRSGAVRVSPVLFRSPEDRDPLILAADTLPAPVAGWSLATAEFTVTPEQAGSWVGIHIRGVEVAPPWTALTGTWGEAR